PALALPEPGNRPALGDVLEIVPIMKLIGMRAREIKGGKQQTLGHRHSPRLPAPYIPSTRLPHKPAMQSSHAKPCRDVVGVTGSARPLSSRRHVRAPIDFGGPLIRFVDQPHGSHQVM